LIFSSGLPERPQSLHDTSSSDPPVFLFSLASPKQKSQYGDGCAADLLLPPPLDVFFSVVELGVGGPAAPAASAEDVSEDAPAPLGEEAAGK